MTSRQAHDESERTCIGCRKVDSREALLRLAIVPIEPYVVPDALGKLGGRGASVHPTWACVKLATERGGLSRAAKRAVPMDAKTFAALAASQYERRLEGLLSGGRRAREIAVGVDSVREALETRGARCLVVASDAGGSRDEMEAVAARLGRACIVWGTRATLGAALGRGEVAVAAILDEGIAGEVARCVERARALTEDA